MKKCVSNAPARADRESGPPEKHNEKRKTLDGPVVGYVGFEVMLGTILDVILEFTCSPNPIVTHFGHPGWPSWPSFGDLEKCC